MASIIQEESIDEVELVCQIYQARQGDSDSLLAIFNLFRPELVMMVNRLPLSEREDMLQEAFIRIQYCVHHYAPSQGPFAHYVRSSLSRFTRSYPAFHYQPLSSINGHEAANHQQFEAIEVQDLLLSLPQEDRQLIEAYVHKERTIKEIAAITRKTSKQVSNHLTTIFTKMRELL